MNDADRMCRRQRVGDVGNDPRGFRHREWPAGQALGKRLPLVVRHRDERLPVYLANLIDGADVWMIQRTGGSGLAPQALSRFVAGRRSGRKKLQSDMAMQVRVFGEPDRAHATGPEVTEDGVMGDSAADHNRILRRRRRL